ncbi:Clavaminate synthase-like protein [Colletotrichum scovillei]|uniref:Clavaminate synthase-like protein n=1 Tax=Colletotrichum scovillei TaxID=1209932 RepID=A0A9P7R5Y9_9PEZI|nr:Clavaminate synthase-like protein [Colletotrichum scovillei]KAG7068889.1 Clavaminate synthase-like protein [Colletotrichum scovillei]KAG7072845.1 Clavaminate synthase-like protein [Colletotrichum scovillei]
MAVQLEAFEVPGARTYFGHALPYGLQVKSSGPTGLAPPVADSAAALRALGNSGKLQDLLDKHGAVLIRGAGHASAETFSKLVGAAEKGRGSYPHVQIGLAGKRTPLADNVWTANEGSPSTRFYQHNEYSRYTRFPSNIHFYCGATPIASSANVFEKVQAEIPELVEEISKRGLGMKMVFRAPGNEAKVNQFNWAGEHSFGQELTPEDDEATTKQKVEKQVRKLTSDFKWNEDGSLELTQHIPGIRRLPASGRPVWFNGLVGRHGITRDIGALDPPHIGRDGMTYLPSVYGDDTEIPRRLLDKLIDVIDKEEISLILEEGDLLLVDNFQVSHGREPWEGDRQILVSMWDTSIPIGQY